MLKERQKLILEIVIKEHIKTAQPVSSFMIAKKYSMDFCPATIRNEMLELTKKNYLYKPYLSSGRIPTTKGYQFLVEKILEEKTSWKKGNKYLRVRLNFRDTLRTFEELLEKMAQISSSLILGYLPDQNLVIEKGWTRVLLEPEFQQRDCFKRFIKFVEFFEKNIEEIFEKEIENNLEIFVGKDNPLTGIDDFSMILAKPQSQNAPFISLVGPKRMPYKKNISLMEEALNLLSRV